MKKFLSILMVMAMVFSLGISVFAAESDTGSITVTNATVGETYSVYKIFDASVSYDENGVADAVSYSIAADSQFFAALFGDGTADNSFFAYNANTGTVTKKDGVNDSELIKYLTELIEDGTYTASATTQAESKEVKFTGLNYGYYLITSSLGATVTINSNTPDVKVIDKNQTPGGEFKKEIQIGVEADGETPIWGTSNSANIGDKVTYKVSFEATNYDGDKQIMHYQVHDEKGDAIWVEFNSFKVYVGDQELTCGYYLSQGGKNTGNWSVLGTWNGVDEADKVRKNAQWYLVHLDEDRFRITIPWLTNHTLTDIKDGEGNVTAYSLTYGEDAVSKYDSPSDVVITYDAVIEANASIGSTTHGNRFNNAHATWTSANETGSTSPSEVVTYVYGIGVLKDDQATGENLAGAKFRIYSDKDCTVPVYIIPTTIQGVYIVDSKGTAIETASGSERDTTRGEYAAGLDAYLGENAQDNYAVTPINGKIVILGLKEGTYYLKEVEAPAGYNALTAPVEIKAGEGTKAFSVFADKNGNVANIQDTDGTHNEISYDLTSTVVHNSKGVVLPSTGGEGTFWLITIGTLLAIGFAVFLITHKKMTVYAD